MFRTTAISLILILSVSIMLPFANSAHGVRQSAHARQQRSHRYRSRAWWRRYRARMRKKRAAAALAHRNALLELPKNITLGNVSMGLSSTPVPLPAKNIPVGNVPAGLLSAPVPSPAKNVPLGNVPAGLSSTTLALPESSFSAPVTLPAVATSAPPAMRPRVVSRSSFLGGEVKPAANSAASAEAKPMATMLPGQMNVSVVALSRPNPAFLTAREESRMLAGIPVADLRRLVIDKMVMAGGWVTNDFVREVKGTRVFVVTARTPRDARSPEKAWTFYFTEAGGRIYGLTTDAPLQLADVMSNEAERFLSSLRATSDSNR